MPSCLVQNPLARLLWKVLVYKRVGVYPLNEVLPFVSFKRGPKKGMPEERVYEGHAVRMNSARYRLFATKGIRCIACGAEGSYFALEHSGSQNPDRYHFNLYAVVNGEEVMMTKDHIIPKSKGGKSIPSNLQVMCRTCNERKGDVV